jgi:hypothetical protein
MFFWILAPCGLVCRRQCLGDILYPSSGLKFRELGSGGIYTGLEEGKAEGVGQSGTRNWGGGGGAAQASRESPSR